MNENQEVTENIEPEAGKNNNQMMIAGVVIAIVSVVGVIFFAMKGNSNNSADTTALPQADNTMGNEEMAIDQGNPSVEGASTSGQVTTDPNAKQVVIEAGSFYYKPNVMTVKKGQKVQIVMSSKDMMHNFNIDELNVHGPMVKSGETKTIEFTPEKAGTFEYYCSVGQHRKMGQVGKITVTE